MALVGGVILVLSLFRVYPFGNSLLIALAVAAFIGPLNFLLNGGLGNKQDVVRFHFVRSEQGSTFYLEVPSTQAIDYTMLSVLPVCVSKSLKQIHKYVRLTTTAPSWMSLSQRVLSVKPNMKIKHSVQIVSV